MILDVPNFLDRYPSYTFLEAYLYEMKGGNHTRDMIMELHMFSFFMGNLCVV